MLACVAAVTTRPVERIYAWATTLNWPLVAGIAAAIAAAALVVAIVISHRRRRRMRTLEGLLELSPTAFEHAVARLLRAERHRRVRVNGGPGDLQADITATTPDGQHLVVQCKRYAPHNPVGSPAVQTFIGMATVHHHADRAAMVTTSTFTRPARDLAARHGIELVDGDTLVARLNGSRTETSVDPRPTTPPSRRDA